MIHQNSLISTWLGVTSKVIEETLSALNLITNIISLFSGSLCIFIHEL